MRYSTLLLGTLAAGLYMNAALACGYHSGLENATFDTVHPKSLGVAVAIRQATDHGYLETNPAAMTGLLGIGYRDAVKELNMLEGRLADAATRSEEGDEWDFSFVFVRTRLWTRYMISPDRAGADIHTTAAEDSETVVLTDESVLDAIFGNKLSLDDAVAMGLLQFANDLDGHIQSLFRAAFDGDLTR